MILNLTQHVGTPEQGVTEPKDKEKIKTLLTFISAPSGEEMIDRATALAELALEEFGGKEAVQVLVDSDGQRDVMIGGAPYLMAPLEIALLQRNLWPVYSFSVRVSEEVLQLDGTVRKNQVFRHTDFVLAAGIGMGSPWEP